ncbi:MULTISPECIES: DUF262 domain-containing protein [Streptococcus]|uniref:Uncharacterized protein n=1 Tax=Streptococcus mitis TaxID=28037 RepID=A0A428DKU8_STRMT|nr:MULTISPECIES: DUF262 domain-containing protein [Streptococcus]MBZ2106108.1 DUF262 domain-containing protein [Streptococcus mitis]MBZ2109677.1 DUF262 domain-containing protein [Streptococcus mitis]RRD33010.1 DUF262 domain-containing protein [Streptococcus sp. OH4692_COT-348]RSI95508.1 hypothetical protein D8843_09260 [Streptococcus mitis]
MTIQFTSKKVGELLKEGNLRIPSYQRSYKWNRKHIRNLFYDLRDAMGKKEYQIGSVILHENDGYLDIVDGQQRLISISLFLHLLDSLENYKGANQLLSAEEFGELSCYHASENYNEWENLTQLVGENQSKDICNFLLENCSVSVITMPQERLSEAFQLFDSQNNRGKSLEPHDLLKAYHLRKQYSEDEKIVEKWEQFVEDKDLSLKELFDKHLFRMRRWSRGETGLTNKRYGSYLRFTEDFIDDFKGVDLNQNFPYLELYRHIEKLPMSISMPIIDGSKFFEYIESAHETIKEHKDFLNEELGFSDIPEGEEKNLVYPEGMLNIYNSSKGRYLKCHNIFLNICSLFADRFGKDELSKEIVETLFIWSYYPRVKSKAIYDATVGKYAAGGSFRQKETQKLFQLLSHAVTPNDFIIKIDRELFENYTVDKIIEEEKNKW